jgi:DNA-binding FadR family transcriptional regulator
MPDNILELLKCWSKGGDISKRPYEKSSLLYFRSIWRERNRLFFEDHKSNVLQLVSFGNTFCPSFCYLAAKKKKRSQKQKTKALTKKLQKQHTQNYFHLYILKKKKNHFMLYHNSFSTKMQKTPSKKLSNKPKLLNF